MINFLKDFYYEEEGMTTVEIVLIIAVLIALALIFKDRIGSFAESLMTRFFNTENIDGQSDGNMEITSQ